MRKAIGKDIPKLIAYCSERPVMNLFMIGDMIRYGCNSSMQDIWVVEDDGHVGAIYLRYHDTLLLCSYTGNISIEPLRNLIKTYKIRSIHGEKEIIAPLYHKIREFKKKQMFLSSTDTCIKDIPSTNPIHIATEADALIIAKAFGHIKEFQYLYSNNTDERESQIRSRITHKEGTHLFIQKNEAVISHGNTAAETDRVAMIGGIMTLPAYRGRGHGSHIVSTLIQRITNQGKYACTLTDTPPEQSFMRHFGFTVAGEWWILSRL